MEAIRKLRIFKFVDDEGNVICEGNKYELANILFVTPKTISNKKRVAGYTKITTNKKESVLRKWSYPEVRAK